MLFIAGDDDQSIYSFRHADPDGIIEFPTKYPLSETHILTDCFRCTPAVLNPALRLIAHNPNRAAKRLVALYANAAPPVQGTFHIWSFANADEEARAIAESCEQLIANGMSGRENEVVILISSRRIQLDILTRELGNRGIAFDVPSGGDLTDELQLRAVVSLLRLIQEREKDRPDYIAYRTLFALRSGIGATSARNLANVCIQHRQNYRQLFHSQPVPNWLTGRVRSAVLAIGQLTQATSGWSLGETLVARLADIAGAIRQHIFTSPNDTQAFENIWNAVTGVLPGEMTLQELLLFFAGFE